MVETTHTHTHTHTHTRPLPSPSSMHARQCAWQGAWPSAWQSVRKQRGRGQRARGFTLIEMVVTLALLGLFAMLAAPLAERTVQRSKEQELRTALREIRSGIDRYKRAADQGLVPRTLGDSGYPPTLDALVSGVAGGAGGIGGSSASVSPASPFAPRSLGSAANATNTASADAARLYFLRRVPRDPMAADPALPPQATWGLRSHASSAEDPREGDDVFDVYSRASGVGLDGTPYREW